MSEPLEHDDSDGLIPEPAQVCGLPAGVVAALAVVAFFALLAGAVVVAASVSELAFWLVLGVAGWTVLGCCIVAAWVQLCRSVRKRRGGAR